MHGPLNVKSIFFIWNFKTLNIIIKQHRVTSSWVWLHHHRHLNTFAVEATTSPQRLNAGNQTPDAAPQNPLATDIWYLIYSTAISFNIVSTNIISFFFSNEDQFRSPCGTCGGGGEICREHRWGNLNERGHLEHLDVDGRTIQGL